MRRLNLACLALKTIESTCASEEPHAGFVWLLQPLSNWMSSRLRCESTTKHAYAARFLAQARPLSLKALHIISIDFADFSNPIAHSGCTSTDRRSRHVLRKACMKRTVLFCHTYLGNSEQFRAKPILKEILKGL